MAAIYQFRFCFCFEPYDPLYLLRALIMNIIHVLAHGDTDEIRPSDMDNKLQYMLGFSPVYPVCQMYIWLYIHIYNPTSLPSLLGHIVNQIILTWFSHYRLHSSSLSCHQPWIQALIWHLDVFINTFINLRIHATTQNDHTTKDRLLENWS